MSRALLFSILLGFTGPLSPCFGLHPYISVYSSEFLNTKVRDRGFAPLERQCTV